MAGCGSCSSSSPFLVRLVKFVVFVLGVYEFLAFYQLWSGAGKEGNLLYFTRDFNEKALYSAYILTLGLQRLTFVTSCGGINGLSWLTLIGTHLVETLLWWSCALNKFQVPFVNPTTTPIPEVVKTVMGKLTQGDEYVLLCGVPVLCVLFTLAALVSLSHSSRGVEREIKGKIH
jgi:hypothetical protein